jgi:hypothetical protein
MLNKQQHNTFEENENKKNSSRPQQTAGYMVFNELCEVAPRSLSMHKYSHAIVSFAAAVNQHVKFIVE